MEENEKRNCGIDLLRIVSMLMVVTLHVLLFGLKYPEVALFSIKWHISNMLESVCFCAVNIYAMITGYVLVNRRNKIKRIVLLWIEVVFYLLLNGMLLKLFFPTQCSISTFIKAIIPVSSSQYWYFTAYFIMFWFIPLYNWIINNLNFLQFRKLLFTILLVFGFLGWFSSLINGTEFGLNGGYSFLWISIMYFIGASIKKYGLKIFFIKKDISQISVLSCALIFGILPYICKILLIFLTMTILGRQILTNAFYSYLSPTVLIESVCLLIYFSRLKVNKKIMTTISATTFGVYLIHFSTFFQQIAWKIVNKYINAPIIVYIFVIIVSVFFIFSLCSILEIIRMKVFKIFEIDQLIVFFINKTESLILRIGNGMSNK